MQPIKTLKNQYRGINAHLHSELQDEGWNGFHTLHIGHLTTTLQTQLRMSGYRAEAEQSLQIRRIADNQRYNPRADVLIRKTDDVAPAPVATLTRLTTIETYRTSELLMDDPPYPDYYRAIAIYEYDYESNTKGQPVAWMELLSPSNKPGGTHYDSYADKRNRLLESGLVFIELDYLHEQPATFRKLGHYPHDDSSAYRTLIVDPRPNLIDSQTQVVAFAVDAPLPVMRIPLLDDAFVDFDFGVPYQKTFEEAFYGDTVDYTQLPVNFDRYHANDQRRILNRMLAVMAAAQAGKPLDERPLDLPDLSLAAARERYQRYHETSEQD